MYKGNQRKNNKNHENYEMVEYNFACFLIIHALVEEGRLGGC